MCIVVKIYKYSFNRIFSLYKNAQLIDEVSVHILCVSIAKSLPKLCIFECYKFNLFDSTNVFIHSPTLMEGLTEQCLAMAKENSEQQISSHTIASLEKPVEKWI